MDAEGLIERGYRALGGRRPAGDVAAMELFAGLPSHFEVIGVEPRAWAWTGAGRC